MFRNLFKARLTSAIVLHKHSEVAIIERAIPIAPGCRGVLNITTNVSAPIIYYDGQTKQVQAARLKIFRITPRRLPFVRRAGKTNQSALTCPIESVRYV